MPATAAAGEATVTCAAPAAFVILLKQFQYVAEERKRGLPIRPRRAASVGNILHNGEISQEMVRRPDFDYCFLPDFAALRYLDRK